ncbi:MAG TPA: ribonuclease H-like domain-containing protein [Anaeromyxobacteraceae bacterium]|nr:ribonuclease H-like domain-containing protein [Anaeromyxobacteraceae bacterium]
MIRSTFQLAPGIGPYRERQLWDGGVTGWDLLPAEPEVVLSPRLDGRVRAAVEGARAAVAARDAAALAGMVPQRERWRLFSLFADEAGYLDIETDFEGRPTAVGILDRDGPRLFLRGRDLEEFQEATAGWKLLVTFNGLSFDVPMLRRAFPGWRPPPVHVDLCHLWRRLGHQGGLKLLEHEVGIGRPRHLDGVDGRDAVRLWAAWERGDRDALRLFAEYNLLDVVNLRTLMAMGYNRAVERLRMPGEPVPVSMPGDVRYDVTRLVLVL